MITVIPRFSRVVFRGFAKFVTRIKSSHSGPSGGRSLKIIRHLEQIGLRAMPHDVQGDEAKKVRAPITVYNIPGFLLSAEFLNLEPTQKSMRCVYD
jgi:hypothetical protein